MLLLEKSEKATKRFERIKIGYDALVVPRIVLVETCGYFLRKNLTEKYDLLLEELKSLPNVNLADLNDEIIKMAAKVKHTTGIHLVDSIIAATALVLNCIEILSKDKDCRSVAEKFKIKVNAAI